MKRIDGENYMFSRSRAEGQRCPHKSRSSYPQRREGHSGFMPELRKEENRDPLLSVRGVKGGAVPAGFLLLRHRSPAH